MSTKEKLRPVLDSTLTKGIISQSEWFQNKTLRPILKLQHNLLIEAVKFHIKRKKNSYHQLSEQRQTDYLKDQIIGDLQIYLELRGMVVGQFSMEEYRYYLSDHPEQNKRIKTMMLDRILSSRKELTDKTKKPS